MDPAGRSIITYNGARFFGITPPMTDVSKRIEDMDRVGIDVEVVSLSTPNVFFTDAKGQPDVAKMMNDAYADLVVRYPKRFKAFASIPMDSPDAALAELHRTVKTLKLNGVVLLSNIRGAALTDIRYRPFFEEANRMRVCIFLHPMLPVASEPFKEYVLGPIIGFPFDTTLAVARMCFAGML
jgi:aminocarboxymuconate-semialdehyde decarboxylase